MIIVYDSLTGKNKLFADKIHTSIKKIDINKVDGELVDDVLLLTRSINYGDVPKTTLDFLNKYRDKVKAVAVSGNKNWGKHLYGLAGERIEYDYGIPLILKYELSGTDEEVRFIEEYINRKLEIDR